MSAAARRAPPPARAAARVQPAVAAPAPATAMLGGDAAVDWAREGLSGSGEALDRGTRALMETRFGHDFSGVRIHSDANAARAAEALSARAYTFSQHLVFGAGRYAPATAEGRRLLAHELAHVVQQRGAAAAAPRAGARDAAMEDEADRAATAVLAGRRAAPQLRSPPMLARDSLPATYDERLLQALKARPRQNAGADYQAWVEKLRSLLKEVPQEKRAALARRIAPQSKDALGQYFRAQVTDETLRGELLGVLDGPASAAASAPARKPVQSKEPDALLVQLRKGDFAPVFVSLNGLPMQYMLRRLASFQNTDLESLMQHLDAANPLGEKSKNRMAAAIGAVHMSRAGVSVEKLDTLDATMDAAELPGDQRTQIRAILPKLAGGAATRIDAAFRVGQLVDGAKDGKLLEKWSTAKAFRILKELSPAETEDALARVDKAQLQALMMNSRQAENQGELQVEALRQALYVAWVTRYPGERARFDVGETENPILKMSTGAKVAEAMSRSVSKLPGQGLERLKELLTPEAIATMVAFTGAYIASQVTPIGWVADIIIAGLIAATVLMLGREVIDIVKLLIAFSKKASGATSDADLDAAAELFATAVSKAGVDIIMAILFHKAGKAANLRPPGPRSPGLVEVLTTGGGKLKTALTEPPRTLDLVTNEGVVVRLPPEQLPGNAMMMEGANNAGGGGAARGSGTGSGPGKPAAAEPPAAGGKPAKSPPPPGAKLAAADALAKKKPRGPRELAEDARKAATEEAPAPEKKPAAAEDPKAAKAARRAADLKAREEAKTKTLQDIEDVKARKAQTYLDIQEATQRGRQRMTPEERAALDREKAQLAREAELYAAEEQALQKQFAELDISPYQRARAYSYSDGAARQVISRAKGLDEMSGKKLQEPSIDHVVPVEEITAMEGWAELPLGEQQAILSRLDNLRLMEKALNSSKGSKRWAQWEAGRRAYGETVWNEMVRLEGELRGTIQAHIKTLLAGRHK